MSMESFSGLEGSGSMDPKAFEKFQEQMRENAAHIAALQKAQATQQKDEDKLVKILKDFINNSTGDPVVFLIANAIAENIPALVIATILTIGYKDLQEKVGVDLGVGVEFKNLLQNGENQLAVVKIGESESTMPVACKVEIDIWGRGVFDAARSYPLKSIETAFVLGNLEHIKPQTLELSMHCISLHLQKYGLNFDSEYIKEFTRFFMTGIFRNVAKSLERAQLEASEKDKPYL